MVTGFDRIVLSVADLAAAVADYSALLDVTPVLRPDGASAWLGLGNTVIELRQGGQTAVQGLVFAADEQTGAIANERGLNLHRCDGAETARLRNECTAACSERWRVDHVVLRTGDAQACVELFGEQLGIRLALDKMVPEWGGRMLFFRVGQLTLEVIESERDGSDYFWGITYQCADIDAELARLSAAGITCSAARDGRKPGTRVASLKSHDLGIPTLLLQPAPK